MTEPNDDNDLYVAGYVAGAQEDTSETLTGDNTQDPLDAGFTVPDREPKAWEGDTAAEMEAGETLDQKLAEEEPDVTEADIDEADAEPRAGRLVAPDEDGGISTETDEVADDVGRAGYAASAEEAAMHVDDEG